MAWSLVPAVLVPLSSLLGDGSSPPVSAMMLTIAITPSSTTATMSPMISPEPDLLAGGGAEE